MEYTDAALSLMKKYAAKCKIDWNNLSTTVFQTRLEAKARSLNKKKITVGLVRWYWQKEHNVILQKLFDAEKINKQELEYCKVSVKNGCVFHRGMLIEKKSS